MMYAQSSLMLRKQKLTPATLWVAKDPNSRCITRNTYRRAQGEGLLALISNTCFRNYWAALVSKRDGDTGIGKTKSPSIQQVLPSVTSLAIQKIQYIPMYLDVLTQT
jgi:hypothetical protein